MGNELKDSAYYLDKLMDLPEQFNRLYSAGKYAQAKYIYDKAVQIAVFLEVPAPIREKLFGQTDNQDEEYSAKEEALFNWDMLDVCDKYCCIKQHRTYQDIACRKMGEPIRFYSDEDFCAMCRDKKRTV